MNYFIDLEFIEGPKTTGLFRTKRNTIDVISIAILKANETNTDIRDKYWLNKDVDLYEAWYRYEMVGSRKNYWIRNNVLIEIYKKFVTGDQRNHFDFSYRTMKYIFKTFGLSKSELVEKIKYFTGRVYQEDKVGNIIETYPEHIRFYGYYSDYDWVAFCWLFGKMIDLPNGYPMYCIDLKQELDRRVNNLNLSYYKDICNNRNVTKDRPATFSEKLRFIKDNAYFPKQESGVHDALEDVRWNYKLFLYLQERL